MACDIAVAGSPSPPLVGLSPRLTAMAAAAALLLLLLQLPAAAASALPGGGAHCRRPPVLFVFGDSNSDTGGLAAGLGYSFPLPEGRSFFRRGTGRLCDGRLIIDFLCESLNTRYLSPYLEALGSDFSNGANFAVAGSMTVPQNVPFALHLQVMQFLHFRSRSLDLATQGVRDLISEQGFGAALYVIDIGQNDLSSVFDLNPPYPQVLRRIRLVVAEIESAMKTLFENGGRNFWIHGTGPLGCLPQKLAQPRKDDGDLDAAGCLKTFNNAARELNSQLRSLCTQMSLQLRGATVVYTDLYTIKYDLVANHSKYGLEKPLEACCGHGGPPYNYNLNISCLDPGYQVCADGSEHVSWDGVHYSEAANAVAAAKILSAEFSTPRLGFDFFCNGA